jgi:hypothetical protein
MFLRLRSDRMVKKANRLPHDGITRFDRNFFTGKEKFTCIGSGSLGGKAQGLAYIKNVLEKSVAGQFLPDMTVNIPTLTVIATDFFDMFIEQNDLYEVAFSDLRDDQIARAFQKAELPGQLVGDLRALIAQVKTPLAIRSSSMLEDAMFEPFASVYKTKMIPNNQLDADSRFGKLVEAIKYVYASTFFGNAKAYMQATKHTTADEKMAVIIQEVVGTAGKRRFYPQISGVARSYNFYPIGLAEPEDGVVDLAVGLGKIIVDEAVAWSYSPAVPQANPPYNAVRDLLKQTQREFWAIHMGPPPEYDPIKEVEYMMKYDLSDAEADGALNFTASTYRAQDDRIVFGVRESGPRVVDFATILKLDHLPLNELLKQLLKVCEDTLGTMVEIEFAVTLNRELGRPARFGFLQVRPMVVSGTEVEVPLSKLTGDKVLVASESTLGNGIVDTIEDIVYVKPDTFNASYTETIAAQLETMNRALLDEERPYVLVGFGRWGSTDPLGGVPVNFGQISGARVIVEATLPTMSTTPSQGSHFFHNVTSFQVFYFSVGHLEEYRIDWGWLNRQNIVGETDFVRHVRLERPLTIEVDGKRRRGVICHA